MKMTWQEAKPRAKFVVKPIWSQKGIGLTMQVINRENVLVFQTKQTGRNADEVWWKATDKCNDYLKDEDCFWYNPYMMESKDIKTPHYEKRDASLCKG